MECKHESHHTETVQVDYWPTPDVDASYEIEISVCDNCDATIEDEDPAADRAEALAEREAN